MQQATTDLLFTLESRLAPAEAVEAIKAAAAQERFGVLADLDLRAILAQKGIQFGPEVRVIEVCQPQVAATVLSAKIEISTVLPCRIAVFTRGGRTWLSTVRPTALLGLFAAPELRSAAAEVEAAIERIMEHARG